MNLMTWEQAVLSLREDPSRQALVRDAYYDDPVLGAAERFSASPEFRATLELLRGNLPGTVAEIGAGRGIASFGFARAGSQVFAIEPDPSAIVGRGAIAELAKVEPRIVPMDATGEAIPLPDRSVDVVYGRAVLHHAANLERLGREVGRILKPGGFALFTREHVVRNPRELESFLARHPLHSLYGGENAFSAGEYRGALEAGGLRIVSMLGPYESIINYFPGDIEAALERRLGPLAALVRRMSSLDALLKKILSRLDRTPGRHYTFFAIRPGAA